MESQEQKVFNVVYRPDHIAVITVDVPGEKVNTLKAVFAEQMTAMLQEIQQHPGLKGVVIISGKTDSFIAGADITMLDACRTDKEAETLARQGQQVFQQIEDFKVPVVAAIHGACLGGGLELALACHSRVCSLDDKTRLGLPEVQLGLLPGSGGTQRLPRLVGAERALDLMLTGKHLRPSQARKIGLVDDAVPVEILLDAAVKFVKQSSVKQTVSKSRNLSLRQRFFHSALGRTLLFSMAAKKAQQKAQGNYPAIDAILNVVELGLAKGMSSGLSAEAEAFGKLVMTKQSKALRSLFFATTSLKKDNSSGVSLVNVRKIAVLGGGLMGAGIAYISAMRAGIAVRVKDVRPESILNALQYSWNLLSKKVKRRQLRPVEQKQQMSLLSGGTDYQGFSSVDMVIEAVFEDLELKRQMVAEVEQQTKRETIFATNTSSLPISQIAEEAKNPGNIIGLHYFSPADKMPLVEVIPHAGTTPATIATTLHLAYQQGKTPIVVADKAGFYVNRILAPYMNEAARCMLEGEPVENIDNALVKFGFPVGPIMLLDEVGIDVGTKIIPILVEAFGERFAAPPAFDALLKDERKGRKNSKGFYLYTGTKRQQKKKQADPSVYSLLGVTPAAHMEDKLIIQRCIMLMLNEAARCLDEGVIKSARDGDVGAVFGIGFAPFLGGPFHYMDQLGIPYITETMNGLARQFGERFAPCELLLRMSEQKEAFYSALSE